MNLISKNRTLCLLSILFFAFIAEFLNKSAHFRNFESAYNDII